MEERPRAREDHQQRAGLADRRRDDAAARRRAGRLCGRNPQSRIRVRGRARHGRLQPVPRGAGPHLQQEGWLSAALRSRLHGADRDSPPGAEDQRRQHAVHRVVEVGHHDRAADVPPLLLRSGEASQGRLGRRELHRHHRSRHPARPGRLARSLPPRLPQHARHRRAAIRRCRTSAWCHSRSWAET